MSNRVKTGLYRTALTLNTENKKVCPWCHQKTVSKCSETLREMFADHGEDVEHLCVNCGAVYASHYYED